MEIMKWYYTYGFELGMQDLIYLGHKGQLHSTRLCFTSECFAARGKGARVEYQLPNVIVGSTTKRKYLWCLPGCALPVPKSSCEQKFWNL
ncbi:unnamed protein product [Urochloa humidicola]